MGRGKRRPAPRKKKPGEGTYVKDATRKQASEEKRAAQELKDMVKEHNDVMASLPVVAEGEGEDEENRRGLLEVMQRSILRRKRERGMHVLQVPQLQCQIKEKKEEIAGLKHPCMKQLRTVMEAELQTLERRLAEATDTVTDDTVAKDEETLKRLQLVQQNRRLSSSFTTLRADYSRSKGGVATAELGLAELQAMMEFSDAQVVLSQELTMCPKCVFKKLTKSTTMTGARECQACGLVLMAPPSGNVTGVAKDSGRGDSTQMSYISAQHTMKKLAEAQGEFMHRVTPETLSQMRLIIWMRRIRPEELTAWVMRAIQSKMGLSQMYELGGMFITLMRGFSPPRFKHALHKELLIMVKMVHNHWKEFQAIYDDVLEQEALRMGRKVKRRKANFPNAPFLIWRLLQLRGIDYSDWVCPILEARNLKAKDIVLWLVARHLAWDMDGILFKGADVLRGKQRAAKAILNRPLPPLRVFGSAVCAHWAASSDLRPCILVVQTVDRKWFVVVGPLKTGEELVELEGDAKEPDLRPACEGVGLKLDDATGYASKRIAESDLDVPEVMVEDWGYHAVPPSSELYVSHVKPVHDALEAVIESFVKAEEEATIDELVGEVSPEYQGEGTKKARK